jgi:two-component system sensor histidine kinase TctE
VTGSTKERLQEPKKPRPAPSLTRRVLRNVLVPLALTWMVGAVIALVIANYFSEQAFDRGMLDDAYALSANVQAGERGIELLLTPREVATVLFDQVDKVYFAVQRLDGTLISGQSGLRAPLPVDGARYRFADINYEGSALRAVVLEHDAEPGIGMLPYRVIIAQTTLSRTALVRQLLGYALAPQILLLMLLAIWLWYGIRSDLRPLGELQRALDRRDVHDLSPVAVAETSRELQRLGNAVNSLFERLGQSVQAQREFVGNVAHELRTPLAGIRALAEYGLAQQDTTVWREQLERVSEAAGARQPPDRPAAGAGPGRGGAHGAGALAGAARRAGRADRAAAPCEGRCARRRPGRARPGRRRGGDGQRGAGRGHPWTT